MARGKGSERSQGEGGAGLWPKSRLGCHRPSLLATSPAPSPPLIRPHILVPPTGRALSGLLLLKPSAVCKWLHGWAS